MDDKQTAVRALLSCEQMNPTYEERAAAVWDLLDPAEQETLSCLARQGPVWDGDVPSKTARSSLIGLGLASKAVVKGEHGYQVANYAGWAVWHEGTA